MPDRLGDATSRLEFEVIRQGLLSVTGFDIGSYRPSQMLRLLSTIMGKAGAKDFPAYLHLLRLDKEKVREFKNCITINVSEFFRDRSLFDFLEENIIPGLLKKSPRLFVWSAGCAGGEEPYSMALMLEERLKRQAFDYKIYATDIDEETLSSARHAAYPEKSLKNVSQALRETYFEKTVENFRLRAKVKARVQFETRDLLKPLEMHEMFQLVVCRNVVIYFSEKAKATVYQNLVSALAVGGVLFIGATENLLNYRDFGLEKIETYFYRKLPVQGNG